MQSCARCGFVVYPAEKINCIDQNWHKACFHCDVCKMVLTANNFVSHKKRPYCSVHNPRNNTFTSVYETPININAKKQSKASSELKYREDGERFMSTFHVDMRSMELEKARLAKLMASQAYQSQTQYSEQQTWYSGTVSSQEMVRVSQAQHNFSDVKYTEQYEESKGKGSFPAMITPGYQSAKNANTLASNLEYKKGHDERVSTYTVVADPPEVIQARNQAQISSDYAYTEEYEQHRGKGSFPAHITPGYKVNKKATELASDVKYRQMYEQEMKGKVCAEAGVAEAAQAKGNAELYSQIAYTEGYEQQRGKGSFPAMITPGYLLAKKAQAHASGLTYKKDLTKMKGTSHFHSMTAEDNLALMNARKVNKMVSGVEYKKDMENTKGHSINFCETPQFMNAKKFTSDNKYKEKANQMKTHYEDSGLDKKTVHAMKVRKLASDISYKQGYEQEKTEHGEYSYPATMTQGYKSQRKLDQLKDKNYRQHVDQVKYNKVTDTPDIIQAKKNAALVSNLNYKADYEKTKHQYTFQDRSQIKNAKANAALCSDIKYKEEWEKTKSRACDIGADTLTVKAAKASRDLASDIKYKESFRKDKASAVCANVSDSKTLHCLALHKMSSDIEYKKGSKEGQAQFSLPLDMVNLSHAKKAQALASDLDYRKKLHDYTVDNDDIKVLHAKKAYAQQSENQYRSDLNWMKGVGWEAEGCMNITQAKKAGDMLSDTKYRQKADSVKFTQVADDLSIKHAKKSQELQSNLAYKADTEQTMHQYTMSNEEPMFKQAKANADLLSMKVYKSSWEHEQQRDKGFELTMDSLAILTAKAKRDLASNVKYKEEYEKTKGKMIGVKTSTGDSQMNHSSLATKLQSDRHYRKDYEDNKCKYKTSLDMLNISHAKKAQDLATETNYRTMLHDYTTLPTDMSVSWAKKAYGLQSDKQYRSDLMWMKGVGWEASGSLDVQQAKKAGDMLSEKKYRQNVSGLKFTSVENTPEMVQAKLSNKLILDRLYKEKGQSMKHKYTLGVDLPEHVQAKLNAMNLSESRYKESWSKIRDGGYKLRLDAIPFQSAKASADILSDQKYKGEFERSKGKMICLKGLQDDLNMSHSVNASKLQSDIKYKKKSAMDMAHHHLPMDMLEVTQAKKAQALASEQDYRHTLHQYTSLYDDMKVQAAKKAYALQSEKVYRSDLNYLRGNAWIGTGALQIEGSKKASDLISDKKYRQQPYSFKHTSVADSPDIVHAKMSGQLNSDRLYKEKGASDRHNYTLTAQGLPEFTQSKINAANFSDIKYKESWHTLRAQGYKLCMQDIPFQAAKTSTGIASDYQYKHTHVLDKGKHIGSKSVLDDPRLLHCLQAGRLCSDQGYRKDALSTSGQYHLNKDMVGLVMAKNAQALASDQDYKTRLHAYTVLPDDMKVQWAKKAYNLQSEKLYKSDLNFMKGVAWDGVGAPQMESAKKAGELISNKKYRQLPDSLKFTAVADSPDMVHAKHSYQQNSERLYKSGKNEDMHKYTLHFDDPDFLRAKLNAQQISNKVYKASADQGRSAGFDLRLDAIPFQTAKASREIASDFRYKESHVKDKGQQVGLQCVQDDPKMVHNMAASKLQSSLEYKRQSKEERSHYQNVSSDRPEFLQAKKSQAQASDLTYRQRLHSYTCDAQQLDVQHAKQAYKLQSDVNYKSDLNWIRGAGWTPPGSHKAELARRAAELGLAEGVTTDEAIAQYQHLMMLQHQQMMEQQQQEDQCSSEQTEETTTEEMMQPGVNMDAMEVLHVKRKKTIQTVQQKKTTTSSTSTSSSSFRSMEKKSVSSSSSSKQTSSMAASSSMSSSSALEDSVKTSSSRNMAAIEEA